MPLVSIVIPLYNRRDLIGETIHSLRMQSLCDLEVLIVDDGSTDGGPEYVNSISLSDSRIRLLYRNSPPKGAPHCRNIGIQQALGKYILFLDSDDILSTNCLKNRVSSIQQTGDSVAVIGQALIFEQMPGDSRKLWNKIPTQPQNSEHILTSFLRQDMPFANGAPLWSRKMLNAIGEWNQDLHCFQDWEFHIRACIERIPFTFQPSPDFFVRRSATADQISRKHNLHEHLKSRILAIDSVLKAIERSPNPSNENKKAIRGLILRNILDIADHRENMLLSSIRDNYHIMRYINPVDNMLIKWLANRSPDWRYRRKYRFLPDIIWKNLDFDSSRLKQTYMNCTWLGDLPH